MDWTATGTVLQALATLLLVGLAFWAGRSANASAKTAVASLVGEWERLNDDRERALAAQARRVYAGRVVAGGNAANLKEPSVKVTNGSDLPIYDVVVVVTPEYDGDGLGWLSKYGSNSAGLGLGEIMPHQSEPLFGTRPELILRLGWGDATDSRGNHYYTLPDHVRLTGFTADLHFRDASGLTWKRDPKGLLSRTSDLAGADNTGP